MGSFSLRVSDVAGYFAFEGLPGWRSATCAAVASILGAPCSSGLVVNSHRLLRKELARLRSLLSCSSPEGAKADFASFVCSSA